MSFAEPKLLWLLLLAPAVATVAAGLWYRRLEAAVGWAARGLWDRLLAGYHPLRLHLSVALLALTVLGTALALARPRWGLAEQQVERRGVDVVFILDSSLSMASQDVRPSRLSVAKTLIRRVHQAAPQNRLALVQAEGTGEVLSPLTVDGSVIDLLLDTVEPGSLANPGTALAPAIDTALQLFLVGESKHRVLVILSDGEDHGGGLPTAGQQLLEAGVVTHTLGVGTLSGAPVPQVAGSPEVKRDAQGKVVISRLGEEALESLARSTGGVYLRVPGSAVDLEPLLRRLDEKGAGSLESQNVEILEERFQWPLAMAVVALVVHLGVGPFRRRRAPAGSIGEPRREALAEVAP